MLIPAPIPMPAPLPPPRSMPRSFRETRPSDVRTRAASTATRKTVMVGARGILLTFLSFPLGDAGTTMHLCRLCAAFYGFRGVCSQEHVLCIFFFQLRDSPAGAPERSKRSGVYRTQKQGLGLRIEILIVFFLVHERRKLWWWCHGVAIGRLNSEWCS